MEDALSGDQFQIYLQPKYRIIDGALAGAEALVRWEHPEWGVQSPANFIPLFEKNGFITKMDQYVWEKTCRVLQEWEDKGYPQIPVSVNVSRADIFNADLSVFSREPSKNTDCTLPGCIWRLQRVHTQKPLPNHRYRCASEGDGICDRNG